VKVIFLDIDGVLINQRYASRNTADPKCVEQLNRITDRTGAKIVVSSSWKHHGLPRITLILKQWGVTGDIIDITPDWPGYERRWEIMGWLSDSVMYQDLNNTFVVIDDERDAFPSGMYGVRPRFECGLNVIDADRAIAILEGFDPRGVG